MCFFIPVSMYTRGRDHKYEGASVVGGPFSTSMNYTSIRLGEKTQLRFITKFIRTTLKDQNAGEAVGVCVEEEEAGESERPRPSQQLPLSLDFKSLLLARCFNEVASLLRADGMVAFGAKTPIFSRILGSHFP